VVLLERLCYYFDGFDIRKNQFFPGFESSVGSPAIRTWASLVVAEMEIFGPFWGRKLKKITKFDLSRHSDRTRIIPIFVLFSFVLILTMSPRRFAHQYIKM
jgi:hypothetical protein